MRVKITRTSKNYYWIEGYPNKQNYRIKVDKASSKKEAIKKAINMGCCIYYNYGQAIQFCINLKYIDLVTGKNWIVKPYEEWMTCTNEMVEDPKDQWIFINPNHDAETKYKILCKIIKKWKRSI